MLDKREVENLEKRILRKTNIKLDLSKKFVLKDWDGRIWIGSRGLSEMDFSNLNISSIGLHLCDIKVDGSVQMVLSQYDIEKLL